MKYNSKAENCTDFFYHAFRNVLIIGLPLVIISAIVLSSLHSSAAELSSADNLSISIPTACTLASEVNDAHSTQVLNGTYVPDIGKTTITTYCNDENGYVIYAAGYSNDELGNNKLISSRSTSTTNFDISSNTNSSGNTSGWAMKLTTTNVGNLGGEPGNEEYGYITNNAGNTVQTNQGTDTPTIEPAYDNVYGIVPSQWTKVVTKPSNTVASTTGSSFSTTYATYISPTQVAGTYLGQVKYLLTHPSAATPTNAYIMQEVADWEDELVNDGDTIIAIDARDGKEYYVARLADGHIWMTQNLDFDMSSNTTLSSNTTDLNVIYNSTTGQYTEYNNGYTIYNGVINWTPTNTTINFSGTNVTGWRDSFTEPYSANKTDSTETGHASLGNYYNWTAAIASNNSSTLTSSTYNNIANNPQNSICPRGWRLPTISSQSETTTGSTSEFARLNFLYNDNKLNDDYGLTINPLFFIKAGRIYAGSLVASGYGYYWSSTLSNSSESYNLNFSSNTVLPNDSTVSSYRIGGKSVRCIAR